MTAFSPPDLGRIDGIPAQELLEGLGHLHQFVVVTDTNGNVRWMSRALARGLSAFDLSEGIHAADVCLNAFTTPDAGAEAEPPNDDAGSSVRRQIDSILRHLEKYESLTNRRLELRYSDGAPLALHVSAFRVERQNRNDPNTETERLYIGIAQPATKTSAEVPFSANSNVEFLRAVLDAGPDALLVVDHHGFINYANPGVSALLGRPPSDLIDKPMALYLPKAAYLIAPDDATSEGKEESLEVPLPNGERSWVSASARSVRLPNGETHGWLLHLRERTDAAARYEKIKSENAALESYVHSVSHDLRSPLVSLLGFTRLLREDWETKFDKAGRHFLDRIEQAGGTMEALIRDLLELCRLERSPSPRGPADPRGLLVQIHSELKPRLDRRGVSLSLPNAPPMLHCDRTQLYQIFSNLIGNALQHMGECESPEIRVEISEQASQHLIRVRDNGCGVPAAEHERIFEAFQTLGKRGSESTGIGLAIVKKIALAHEGKAWVESEPGHGASFLVSLPRR